MLVNRDRYEKNDLIRALVQFKVEHKRLPVKEDWQNGEIKPSLRTFQRRTNNIEELLQEADQYKSVLEFEDKLEEEKQKKEIKEYKRKYKKRSESNGKKALEVKDEPRKRRRRPTAIKHSGFQCPFCGSWTSGADKFYSSLKKIIITRLLELLDSDNGQNYFNAVMDSIHTIFKVPDSIVRQGLQKEGYLEIFNQRFGIQPRDLERGDSTQLKCHVCGKYYEDYDITLDYISPYRTEYICENCEAKKKK